MRRSNPRLRRRCRGVSGIGRRAEMIVPNACPMLPRAEPTRSSRWPTGRRAWPIGRHAPGRRPPGEIDARCEQMIVPTDWLALAAASVIGRRAKMIGRRAKMIGRRNKTIGRYADVTLLRVAGIAPRDGSACTSCKATRTAAQVKRCEWCVNGTQDCAIATGLRASATSWRGVGRKPGSNPHRAVSRRTVTGTRSLGRGWRSASPIRNRS
jgi:hypothetical protein